MKNRIIVAILMIGILAMTACGNEEVNSVEEVTGNVQQESVEMESSISDSAEEMSTEVKALNTYYAVFFTGTDQISIDAVKAIRSVTDYDLEEAKAIVDQEGAIINFYASEDEANNAVENLNTAGLNAEIKEVIGNFEIDNFFRIDKAFSLSDRGTSVIGMNYRGVMKQDQIVYLVKKDGTAIETQITFIEEARNMVEETIPGVTYGIGVSNLEKEDIEAGDILIATDIDEESNE